MNILEQVWVRGVSTPFNAAQHTLARITFHLCERAQFLHWRKEVLHGLSSGNFLKTCIMVVKTLNEMRTSRATGSFSVNGSDQYSCQNVDK
jgi:hypothetical protein